jgi:hypothetical protein
VSESDAQQRLTLQQVPRRWAQTSCLVLLLCCCCHCRHDTKLLITCRLESSLCPAFLGGGVSAFFFFGTACTAAISLRTRAIWSSRYDLVPDQDECQQSNLLPALGMEVRRRNLDFGIRHALY